MSADTLGAGAAPAGAAQTQPAPGPSAEERAELERLRAENQAYANALGALEPYADRIKRYVTDEAYRAYVDESSKYYDDLQQRKPAAVSPELQALRDEILGEIKPIKELVETHKSQVAADLEARKTRAFNEGKPIVLAFLEEHPELKTSMAFGRTLEALQAEAVEKDRPFKEVWDNYVSGFVGTRRKAPPAQTRANMAEPGIPAAPTSAPGGGERPKTIREAFLATHARLSRRAS